MSVLWSVLLMFILLFGFFIWLDFKINVYLYNFCRYRNTGNVRRGVSEGQRCCSADQRWRLFHCIVFTRGSVDSRDMEEFFYLGTIPQELESCGDRWSSLHYSMVKKHFWYTNTMYHDHFISYFIKIHNFIFFKLEDSNNWTKKKTPWIIFSWYTVVHLQTHVCLLSACV